MPRYPHRLLARALTAACTLALLAAITVTWPTAHPPERIATTTTGSPEVVINPTAIPPELAPTTTTVPVEIPIADPPPTTRPPRARPTFTPSSSVDAAIAAHFGDMYDQAVAVAMCESTMNPNAVGGNNYGLMQINAVHADDFEQVTGVPFTDGWPDPMLNAQYARHLYDESGGWGPWSCRP